MPGVWQVFIWPPWLQGDYRRGCGSRRQMLYACNFKDGAKLEDASDLVGLNNYDVVKKLSASYGEKIAVISIGRAGEMLLGAASIAVTDMELRPTRHAGRGGLGAVMGSKGLKAVVVDSVGAGKVR